MKSSLKMIYGSAILFLFQSCSYETYTINDVTPNADCGEKQYVYADVKNIFENSENGCSGCHPGNSLPDFSDESKIRDYIRTNKAMFEKAIDYSSSDESKRMPPSGKLPDDTIAKIKTWICQGIK